MRRRMMILLVALLLAGVSGVAFVAFARSVDRHALAGRQGVWVVLATRQIPAHTTGAAIRQDRMTRRVLMPAETVPAGALAVLDSSLDALRLSLTLQPDQLLMLDHFTSAAPPADDRLPVPDGMLAVSVQLSIAPQVGGNVAPGDQVAVFDTYPATPDPGDKQATRILLPRATVISIGAAAAPSASAAGTLRSGGTAAGADDPYLVTFALDQSDAQRLIHASRTGLLYLALLDGSAEVAPAPAVDDDGLFS